MFACSGAVSAAIDNYFARTPADFLSLSPGEIRHVVDMALSGRAAQGATG